MSASAGAGGAAPTPAPNGAARTPGTAGAAGRSGAAHHSSRSRDAVRRSIGSPRLFAIIYTSLASAIYFSLGVVAGHALGLTPVVFLIAAMVFALTAFTYVEGASLHQDRGGATVFARYAFNELVSFVAGWAVLLDYTILIAVTAYTTTQYLKVFWKPLGGYTEALLLSLAIIAFVVRANIRGFGWRRLRRVGALVIADLGLQLLIVVLGLALFFNPHTLLAPIHLGSSPTWSGFVFALTIAAIAFTSLESASGLAGEVRISRTGLKRIVASSTGTVSVIYVGMALVAVTALPVHDGHTALSTRYLDDPVVGIVSQMHPHWLEQTLRYTVAALAALTLVAAANSAMLGLSRLAYSLSINGQIPSGLGRLHPVRSTPYVLILIAGAMAAGLAASESLDFMVGLYAFGAMLAFTIAHLSICKLRYSEPDRDRPYSIPLSIRVRGGELPLPAVFGALISSAGWLAVMIVHGPARWVGVAWMAFGVALYVLYRRADETSLLKRVTVAPQVLRSEPAADRDYGSILVPLLGTELDDDIVQTAARLVSGEQTDEAAIDEATIEAIWVFVIPMSLPLDARLPEAQVKEARQALARAKAVGEEYGGVQVATAMVRARRVGFAIVEEARRRGVEAIVLAADAPSRVKGGSRLGGRGAPLEDFVGDATRYVVSKADCRVIVTAPAAGDAERKREASIV